MKPSFLGESSYEARSICQKCKRATFCKAIQQQLRELNRIEVPVWDKATQDTIDYIESELQMLGYNFPNGSKLCRLSKLSHRDIQDLIYYIKEVITETSA